MEILRLMAILLLIISVIAIGSNVIYKDNFVVIEGSIDCNANTLDPLKGEVTYTNKEINYPEGFNKDNCVVVSIGGKNFNTEERGYSYAIGGVPDVIDLSRGTEPKRITLTPENINISLGNISTESKTKYYRIVLMKIK